MCRTNDLVGHKTENMSNKRYRESDKWRGCLCRFWNKNKKKERKIIGLLSGYSKDFNGHKVFWCNNSEAFYYCEPVKLEEVEFYKDK